MRVRVDRARPPGGVDDGFHHVALLLQQDRPSPPRAGADGRLVAQ